MIPTAMRETIRHLLRFLCFFAMERLIDVCVLCSFHHVEIEPNGTLGLVYCTKKRPDAGTPACIAAPTYASRSPIDRPVVAGCPDCAVLLIDY
jgi:hypothetical protein